MTLTDERAYALHCADLARLAAADDDDATRRVAAKHSEGRAIAASELRLILARALQRDDACTASQWQWIVCRTPDQAVGIVDIALGAAWHTGEGVPTDVHYLGVEDVALAANPGANLHLSEPDDALLFDGTRGSALIGTPHPHPGSSPPPQRLPDGWRQIMLPPWRGWQGDGRSRVPVDQWQGDPLTLTLAAQGLVTCYGTRGPAIGHVGQPWTWPAEPRTSPLDWRPDGETAEAIEAIKGRWSQQIIAAIGGQPASHPGQSSPPGRYHPYYQPWSHQVERAAQRAAEAVMDDQGITWVLREHAGDWVGAGLGRLSRVYESVCAEVYRRCLPVAQSAGHEPSSCDDAAWLGALARRIAELLVGSLCVPSASETLTEMTRVLYGAGAEERIDVRI